MSNDHSYRENSPIEQLRCHASTGDVRVLNYWLDQHSEWFETTATDEEKRERDNMRSLVETWRRIEIAHGKGAALNIDDPEVLSGLLCLPAGEFKYQIQNAICYKSIMGSDWHWLSAAVR